MSRWSFAEKSARNFCGSKASCTERPMAARQATRSARTTLVSSAASIQSTIPLIVGAIFGAPSARARRFDFGEVGCYNASAATPRPRGGEHLRPKSPGALPPEETTMALNLRDFLASLGDDLIRVDDEIDPITQAGA